MGPLNRPMTRQSRHSSLTTYRRTINTCRTFSTSMADVFGESDEEGNNDAGSGEVTWQPWQPNDMETDAHIHITQGSSGRKRRQLSEEREEPSPKKKTKRGK